MRFKLFFKHSTISNGLRGASSLLNPVATPLIGLRSIVGIIGIYYTGFEYPLSPSSNSKNFSFLKSKIYFEYSGTVR